LFVLLLLGVNYIEERFPILFQHSHLTLFRHELLTFLVLGNSAHILEKFLHVGNQATYAHLLGVDSIVLESDLRVLDVVNVDKIGTTRLLLPEELYRVRTRIVDDLSFLLPLHVGDHRDSDMTVLEVIVVCL